MGFLFGGAAGRGRTARTDTRAQGDAAEAQAVAWLERRGLRLVQRNYRTPGRGGGEIDAIMRAPDGTLVEPFALIPLAWLFAFLALIFGACLLISRLCRRHKRRK